MLRSRAAHNTVSSSSEVMPLGKAHLKDTLSDRWCVFFLFVSNIEGELC